jgi:predicted glycosyltransferase
MSAGNQAVIHDIAKGLDHVQVVEFTRDLASYMLAADLVVSMAGYNTIVEILSMNKRAVVVPRVKPVQEQWIRASRLDGLGLLKCLDPSELTPERLMKAVSDQLAGGDRRPHPATLIDFDGLDSVSRTIGQMLDPVPPWTADSTRRWRVRDGAGAVACSGSW